MNPNRTSSDEAALVDPAATSAHFKVALRNFHGLLRTNSFGQALVWARQCDALAKASGEDEQKSAADEAYVALILVCAAKFEAHTLHCGNITKNHAVLADIIDESTTCLVERMRNDDRGIPRMVSLAMQGFSKILRQRVNEVAENELPTATESVVEAFVQLDQIVQYATGLTRTPELYALTFDECVVFSATAMSNATYELNWLLPSDWEKAKFYAARVLELLCSDPPPDRPGLDNFPRTPKVPMLAGIVQAIPQLTDALNKKEYRTSKGLLKKINAQFEAIIKPTARF